VHPWWEVYQPIDYNLTSRMGNEAQFKQMVATCRKAGVKVYVDAVINHMSGQGNLSYGGVTYSKYNYPGLYNTSNFHHFPAHSQMAPFMTSTTTSRSPNASWSAWPTCVPTATTCATRSPGI